VRKEPWCKSDPEPLRAPPIAATSAPLRLLVSRGFPSPVENVLRREVKMEVVHPRCAGVDVHKKHVTVAIRIAQGRKIRRELREYGTTTTELLRAADWLLEEKVTHVVMESTGPYWRPVWHVLEGMFELTLANARDVKNVPGRKSDMKDPEWLADLFAHGLVRASFVPEEPIQEIRDLTRTRKQLQRERVRHVQRIHKILEYANIKLASVISDVLGWSGRQMLVAIIEGERDPEHLAALGHSRLRASKEELREALTGYVTEHHRFMLKLHLDHIDATDRAIQVVEARTEKCLEPFRAIIQRLDTIPGIDETAAAVIIAEIGTDMSRFPTDGHLLSWAGLCPRLDESAGKIRSRRIRHGDRWLKTTLVQAAWSVVHKRDTHLYAKFIRIRRRRGENKALIAVAASMLTAAYHMIKNEQDFHEQGPDYLRRLDREKAAQRLIRRLAELGLEVDVKERVA
jgi:transposase